jgi:NAD(P)-dependent dehydrogenase (short-subunit alcohol dehydrogenase family)
VLAAYNPAMPLPLHNKRIVITGGTGALGAAVVERFVRDGATCEVTSHSKPDASDVARPNVRAHHLDASDERAVTDFYAWFADLWASVHLVGAFAMSPLTDTALADFEKMFRANAVSAFLCCREATKAIRRSPDRTIGGRLLNVAARPAVVPTPGMIGYSTSKTAVASITQSLAEELRAERIWVNAVLPSTMDTPANRRAMPDADFAKWPKVEEVAEAIAFLVSPANGLTTGALVPVYGQA